MVIAAAAMVVSGTDLAKSSLLFGSVTVSAISASVERTIVALTCFAESSAWPFSTLIMTASASTAVIASMMTASLSVDAFSSAGRGTAGSLGAETQLVTAISGD